MEKKKKNCGLLEAMKIPLHSNIQWETALKMLDQAQKLCQVWITHHSYLLFLSLIY